MGNRMQSPSYPSNDLEQSIDFIKKIHDAERSNSVDRDVAAQAMGYSGLSGRSSKVLSNLLQYGLLEKSGKNEVRVSRRALDILHPQDAETQISAVRDAAREPLLFQRISERFPDGIPSEAALRSFLVREEFTDAAIPSAVKAYLGTFQYLEYLSSTTGSQSKLSQEDFDHKRQGVIESAVHASSRRTTFAGGERIESFSQSKPVDDNSPINVTIQRNKILVDAVLSTLEDAEGLIGMLNATKGFLPSENDRLSEEVAAEIEEFTDHDLEDWER